MAFLGTRTKQDHTAGAVNATASRAQDRSRLLSTVELSQWAESIAMNLQANVTGFCHNGNQDCILEALILNDSLRGVLTELAERQR